MRRKKGFSYGGCGGTSGDSRSPYVSSRPSMSPAPNVSCPGSVHPATSSQVTGAETVGSVRARRVYGVAVVFAAAFWL